VRARRSAGRPPWPPRPRPWFLPDRPRAAPQLVVHWPSERSRRRQPWSVASAPPDPRRRPAATPAAPTADVAARTWSVTSGPSRSSDRDDHQATQPTDSADPTPTQPIDSVDHWAPLSHDRIGPLVGNHPRRRRGGHSSLTYRCAGPGRCRPPPPARPGRARRADPALRLREQGSRYPGDLPVRPATAVWARCASRQPACPPSSQLAHRFLPECDDPGAPCWTP